ncbi:hypothetical protein [Sphaerisporangium aureirubrum]|uniref:Uncharacterized protein n=1 Tax=Sphaerisporangium aureirubrum TaxID=1544736 RepID=A0ABW1NHN4_9ACTN
MYPAGLDPARALRQLASSPAVVRHGLDVDQLRARVRARYPLVGELPGRPKLDALPQVAEVPLIFGDRELAGFEQRMTASLAEQAFVTLSAGWRHYSRAVTALAGRFGVTPVDATADLLGAMRRTADEHQVDWSPVLRSVIFSFPVLTRRL